MKLQRMIGTYRLQNEHEVSVNRTSLLYWPCGKVTSPNPLSLRDHASAVEPKIPTSSWCERLTTVMTEGTLSETESETEWKTHK